MSNSTSSTPVQSVQPVSSSSTMISSPIICPSCSTVRVVKILPRGEPDVTEQQEITPQRPNIVQHPGRTSSTASNPDVQEAGPVLLCQKTSPTVLSDSSTDPTTASARSTTDTLSLTTSTPTTDQPSESKVLSNTGPTAGLEWRHGDTRPGRACSQKNHSRCERTTFRSPEVQEDRQSTTSTPSANSLTLNRCLFQSDSSRKRRRRDNIILSANVQAIVALSGHKTTQKVSTHPVHRASRALTGINDQDGVPLLAAICHRKLKSMADASNSSLVTRISNIHEQSPTVQMSTVPLLNTNVIVSTPNMVYSVLTDRMSVKDCTDNRPTSPAQVEALIDTGAGTQVISSSYFMSRSDLKLRTDSGVRVLAANGEHVPVIGSTVIPLRVGNARIMVNSLVADVNFHGYSIILGSPFIRAAGISIVHPDYDPSVPKTDPLYDQEDTSTVNVPILQPDADKLITQLRSIAPTLSTHSDEMQTVLSINSLLREVQGSTAVFPDDYFLNGVPSVVQEDESDLAACWLEPSLYHSDVYVHEAINAQVEQCPEPYRDRLRAILNNNIEIFKMKVASRTTMLKEHTILLDNTVLPTADRPRKLNPSKLQFLKSLVQDLLKLDIVEPSRPEQLTWLHQPVITSKRSGSFRFTIDYRPLNEALRPDTYPTPVISDILEFTAAGRVLNSLDVRNAYWAVPISKETAHVTAFGTPFGNYQWKRLPQGLKIASTVFQKAIDTVIYQVREFTRAYQDDIVTRSDDYENALVHLEATLNMLRRYHLPVGIDKCAFLREEIDLLGHTVSHDSIRVSKANLDKLLTLSPPTSKSDLHHVLGVFQALGPATPRLAHTMDPLRALLRKNVRFIWNSEHQSAFEEVKSMIRDSPTLVPYKSNWQSIVATDASNVAMGAILVQIPPNCPPEEWEERHSIVDVASKAFTTQQRLYSATDRKVMAVHYAVHIAWPHYCRDNKFTLVTDHIALLWLFRTSCLLNTAGGFAQRRTRYILDLQDYECVVVHRAGADHRLPDSLSRIITSDTGDQTPLINEVTFVRELHPVHSEPSQWKELLRKLHNSDTYDAVREALKKTETANRPSTTVHNVNLTGLSIVNNMVTRHEDGLFVPPPAAIKSILVQVHNQGHRQFDTMLRSLESRVQWHGMAADVRQLIDACPKCHSATHAPKSTTSPSQTLPAPRVVLDRVHMDFLSIEGSSFASFIDAMSRFPYLVAVDDETKESAITAILEYISVFGIPKLFVSDNDPSFRAAVTRDFLDKFGITLHFTSAYSPQSNGLVERLHRTLVLYLKRTARWDLSRWKQAVPMVLFAIRTTPIRGLDGITPYEIMFGKVPSLFTLQHEDGIDLSAGDDVDSLPDDPSHVLQLISRHWDVILPKVSQHWASMFEKSRSSTADPSVSPQLSLADYVTVRTPPRSSKLSPKFNGVYRVVKILRNGAVKLKALGNSKPIKSTVASSNVRRLPVDIAEAMLEQASSNPSIRLGDNNVFEVERIISHRHRVINRKKSIEYLIKWKGYSELENSWEPGSGLNCPDLITEYWDLHDTSSRDRPESIPASSITVHSLLPLEADELDYVKLNKFDHARLSPSTINFLVQQHIWPAKSSSSGYTLDLFARNHKMLLCNVGLSNFMAQTAQLCYATSASLLFLNPPFHHYDNKVLRERIVNTYPRKKIIAIVPGYCISRVLGWEDFNWQLASLIPWKEAWFVDEHDSPIVTKPSWKLWVVSGTVKETEVQSSIQAIFRV